MVPAGSLCFDTVKQMNYCTNNEPQMHIAKQTHACSCIITSYTCIHHTAKSHYSTDVCNKYRIVPEIMSYINSVILVMFNIASA